MLLQQVIAKEYLEGPLAEEEALVEEEAPLVVGNANFVINLFLFIFLKVMINILSVYNKCYNQ